MNDDDDLLKMALSMPSEQYARSKGRLRGIERDIYGRLIQPPPQPNFADELRISRDLYGRLNNLAEGLKITYEGLQVDVTCHMCHEEPHCTMRFLVKDSTTGFAKRVDVCLDGEACETRALANGYKKAVAT